MKIKYATIASAICASLFAGHAAAADTVGGFSTAIAATAQGTEITGTITVAPESVAWERANASAIIATNTVTTAALSNGGRRLSVNIPRAGANSEHTIVALRTINAHKGGNDTFGANTGVQIDVMNGTNPVVPTTTNNIGGNLVGTAYTMELPVLDATTRTPIGTASLPIYATALEQSGVDGATNQSVRTCSGNGTMLRGNAIPATSFSGTAGTAQYTSTRTMFANAGLRSQSDAISEVTAAERGTNTTPTGATTQAVIAGTCNKPTTANTAYLFDQGLFLQSTNQNPTTLNFAAPITEDTSWSVPINVRVQYI